MSAIPLSPQSPDMKAWALGYARAGLPVFPVQTPVGQACSCGNPSCRNIGKHPRTENGWKDATTDAEQIITWWTKWPTANIGMPTGKMSGLIVVDCDPRNGGPTDRYDLRERYGDYGETAEAQTGGGGLHVFFKFDDAVGKPEIGPGIDVQSDGVYVVMAPSLHRSGRRYEWDGIDSAKALLAVSEFPGHWCQQQADSQAAAKQADPIPKVIPDGQKHFAIVSLAGTLRRRGVPEDAAFAACRALHFQSPVSDEDIRIRVRNVYGLYPADGPQIVRPEAEKPHVALPDLVSASELFSGNIQKLRPLIDGMLYDGLTMFVARPKAGKSWFTLQQAVQIAGGRAITGVQVLDHGPVLYGALEEPKSRTMSRLRQIAEDGAWTRNLQFFYDLLPLMGGGADQLRLQIERVKPRALFLDTLTALIKGGGGKRESDVFRSQYQEVSCVRKIAEDYKIPIVLVHHVRKGVSDGAIEAIAGTGGIAAAIDAVWLLKRKPEGEGTLEIVGREAEERTLALRFSDDPFGWSVLGDDATQLLNAERREILMLLREDGALTPAQIAAELSKSRAGIRQLLKRMRDDGQVTKQGKAYIPSHSVSHRVTEKENREPDQ